MSVVGAFTDLKKYAKPRKTTNVSTVILKLHRLVELYKIASLSPLSG